MIFPQNQLNSFRIVQMEMSNSVLSNVVVENSSWYQKTAAEDPFPQTATEERTEKASTLHLCKAREDSQLGKVSPQLLRRLLLHDPETRSGRVLQVSINSLVDEQRSLFTTSIS